MKLRKYKPNDCESIVNLFYETVHTVNRKDYTQEQVNAWATGEVDMKIWNESFLNHYSIVAVEDNQIIGFGDIDATGYLDRLYVHKDFQNQGIATAICDQLERAYSFTKIVTHASITAKPFFEHRGYRVIQQQQVERKGVLLTNYILEKTIPRQDSKL